MGIACGSSYNKKKKIKNPNDKNYNTNKSTESKKKNDKILGGSLKTDNQKVKINNRSENIIKNNGGYIKPSFDESSEKDKEKPNQPNFQQLDSFIEKTQIQDSFFENNIYNNGPYSELKKSEKKDLEEQFEKLSKIYEKDFLKKEKPKLEVDINLINNIITNEDSNNVYKNKIIKEINSIKEDKENKKYKIEYLTILLCGRIKVGKTTLIQYMLKLDDDQIKNVNENEDFVEYSSKRISHLKLIEFKGIGYDEKDKPEAISKKAIDFIRERNKSNNYNDFIHCIWYCISGARLEDLEEDVLNKLKEVYKDSEIPIILVFTNTIDEDLAKEMKDYFLSKGIKSDFVKVLAKKVILEGTKETKYEFGEKDLLNQTLNKCTEALGGKMILLMVNKLSDDIKETMITRNIKNENDIKENIIEEFSKEYNILLDDESFIDYIINILGRKLRIFYDDKEISNSSLNLIIKSDIITKICDYIRKYKAKTKEIIKKIVNSKAIQFIDYQATQEKKWSINIRLDNKRDLKGFKETNRQFLTQNLYYISQRDLINYIIRYFCVDYFFKYRKKLDNFIKNLLNKNNRDEDINKLLKVCFSSKLQDFAIKNKIEFKIEKNNQDNKIWQYELQQHNEVLIKAIENQNPNDLDNNESDKDENEDEDEKYNNNEENNSWFPLCSNNLKYLNNNNIESLNNFLNKLEYQEDYFKIKAYDNPFNKLKEFMKNDLKNFFNLKKSPFIKNLDNQYNKKYLNGKKIPIKKILENEKASSLYNNKIKKEFDKLKNNTNFVSIDYLTVIVIGKSGVGKSTLINGLLKLEGDKRAPSSIGKIGTTETKLYINKKVPFLRIIDTRGIEFDKNYGPSKILENAKEIINNQKKGIKLPCNEEEQIENKDNGKKYNNYVSCIWYCVSNNGIDPQEFEILKGLKYGQNVLPIIIVYTNALDSEKIKNVKIEIQNVFKDLPFFSVLAKPVKNVQGMFGLENLLDNTLDICKNALKGEMFKTIKGLISDEIKKIFRKNNENIKNDVNNEIVSKFINDYNKILDDNNFLKYIYNLLEIVFIGYLKNNNEDQRKLSSNSKNDLQNASMLSNSINDYIDFYKKNAKDFINPILPKKSLKYLDEQAKKEKNEFKQNIAIENKNNKKNFEDIVEKFLTDNFNFISQKYIIYRLITDVRESFSEGVENEINLTVAGILTQNDAYNWSKDIYDRKFDDLTKIVKEFENNIGYGEGKDDKKIKNKRKSSNHLNNPLIEAKEINYPEAPNPYPLFGNNS